MGSRYTACITASAELAGCALGDFRNAGRIASHAWVYWKKSQEQLVSLLYVKTEGRSLETQTNR